MPIANIFIKFCHKDKNESENLSERILTNKYEELILDEIISKLKEKIELCQRNRISDETNTYVPYYDNIIDKKLHNQLSEVKMNQQT